MAQKAEYKLVSGDDNEINRVLTIETPHGWRPILLSSVMASVMTGHVVRSQVMLERVTTTKD